MRCLTKQASVFVCAFLKFALTDLMGRGFFSTSEKSTRLSEASSMRCCLHIHHGDPPVVVFRRTVKRILGNFISPTAKSSMLETTFIRHFGISSKCGIAQPKTQNFPEPEPQLYLQPLPEPSNNTIFLGTVPQNLPVEWRNLCWNFPETCS